MKLDEMARDAADALHVSVAHLEPPPIAEKPRFGRVGVAALGRVAIVLLVVGVGVTWWMARSDTATEEIAVSGAVAEIPRLGLISPRWRASVPVELPLPAALAERLPQSLVGIDEGVVVVYEDRSGSGAFVTVTTQRGDLDDHEAALDTTAGEADVRAVVWAPMSGIVATLTLTGSDTAAVDMAALAESVTTLDDQTWLALQELTGWAAAIRSATGDYDTEPIDVDALDLTDLRLPVALVAALAGVDVAAIDVTADAAPEADWRRLAGGETLPLTAEGHTYTWSSGSLQVLLAITLDDTAASAADELIGGLGDAGDFGPVPDETPSGGAGVYRSAGRLLVHVEIAGWPDAYAMESAEAVAAAILDSAARVETSDAPP